MNHEDMARWLLHEIAAIAQTHFGAEQQELMMPLVLAVIRDVAAESESKTRRSMASDPEPCPECRSYRLQCTDCGLLRPECRAYPVRETKP